MRKSSKKKYLWSDQLFYSITVKPKEFGTQEDSITSLVVMKGFKGSWKHTQFQGAQKSPSLGTQSSSHMLTASVAEQI